MLNQNVMLTAQKKMIDNQKMDGAKLQRNE
jgi:hypothetical protein